MQAPHPPDEKERLAVLRALDLLDTPPEPAFDRITRLVARTLGVPMAAVTLIDENRQWFKSRVGIDLSETSREQAFCAHTILQTTPMVVEDATKDLRFSDNQFVMDAPSVRFYAGVPLRSSGGLALGALCAIDRKPRVLTQEEIDTLNDLADLVTKEIRLRETLAIARSQLALTDAALVASEARFRSMFELASVGIALISPAGGWISVNRALCDIVGYTQEELTLRSVQDITHPDDLHTDRDLLRQLVADEIDHYQLDKRYFRKDGRSVWVHLSVTKKISSEGALEYFVAIVKDIQAQREAEEALAALHSHLEQRIVSRTSALSEANSLLRTREAEFRTVIENANEAYVGMDESGVVTAWNRQSELLFGWSAQEAVGRRLDAMIIPPELRAAHRVGMQRYIETGEAEMLDRRMELPALRRDGSRLTVEASICALDVDGRKLFSAFLHDISGRKATEMQREQEARHDALTGLPNRRALGELLPVAQARSDRSGLPLALLFLDLDGFKQVNDTWGHDAGDELLRVVADRLRMTIRRTDTAIRLAGDEFVLLLEGLQGASEDAQLVAEKVRIAICEPVRVAGEACASVDASIGVVIYQPRSGMTANELISAADSLMYEAKRAGKGRVCLA